MSDSALFVVEGTKAEPRFLEKLYRSFVGDRNPIVVSYGTNIHVLMDEMFEGDELDTDLDLIGILREKDPNNENLSKDYTDTYLIFDMDPQDARFNSVRIKNMLCHFNDSSNEGKLFVNYPMLESYRHLKCRYDPEYSERVVSVHVLSQYKNIVNNESYPEIKQINRHDRQLFTMLIEMNLEKIGCLLFKNEKLTEKQYHSIQPSDVFDRICCIMESECVIPVLNTSLFIPVDYDSRLFFDCDGSLHLSNI